jgi:hypothetical protein
MKKLHFTFLAVILSIIITACNTTKGDPSQPDYIDINQISVRVKNNSALTCNLGNTPQEIISSLGTPGTSYSVFFEMHEKDALVYDYDGSKFYFLDNQLYSYAISSPDFLVGSASAGVFFNIGSPLSSVSEYLPNWSSNKNEGTLSATITNGGQLTDEFIYIEFNPSTDIITSISIRSY